MSRRALRRSRKQREKEQEEEEKNKLEDTAKIEEEVKQKQRDILMEEKDFWTVNSRFITRHHKRPRFEKHVPTEDDFPMPLKWLDVMRFTATSIPETGMRSIDDYWIADGNEELAFEWTGNTRSPILKPQAKQSYKWVEGCETKIQKTTRPDNVWSELWQLCNPKDKLEAIAIWEKLEPERDAERKTRGVWEVKPHEEKTYNKVLAAAIKKGGDT